MGQSIIHQAAAAKQPLHENGGVPVADADMPLSDLDTEYRPDAVAGDEAAIEPGKPASAQNGNARA